MPSEYVPDGLGKQLWHYADGNVGSEQVLDVDEYEYTALNHHVEEQRFLVLFPTVEDPYIAANKHRAVRCELETRPISDALPFIAVSNARGYRMYRQVIAVNGKALLVTSAVEQFLRNLVTTISEPTRLWIRHVCVQEFEPDEKERYWTRAWSDSMYARAKKTIDMHQHLNHMIDKGVIGRTAPSQYQQWKKQWSGLEGGIVFPKVFPVKLGKNFVLTGPPVDSYEYVALDPVADEIRVALLAPAADKSAPLTMHLAHCPLKCEVTFVALSYQWGTDLDMEELWLNGLSLVIRKSLANTLRDVRRVDSTLPLWIDAICINQSCMAEKNRQVPRMGRIYDSAAAVWAYTGSGTTDSGMALKLTKELDQPMIRVNDDGEWHFGDSGLSQGHRGSFQYGENRVKPDLLAKMCAALYRLLSRPYFRRVWICQELAFATNPVIGTGAVFDLALQKLDHAVYNFQSMLQADPSLRAAMMVADPSILDVDVRQIVFIRKLFYFRHCHSGASDSGSILGPMWLRIGTTAPGYLETLILARDFESTDPRDKVFSLWNLSRDKEGLQYEIDYTKSTFEVYQALTKAWCSQHRSLDMIGSVEAFSASSASFYASAPSWCTDWQVSSISSCLVRREAIPARSMMSVSDLGGSLYSCDGGMKGDHFEQPFFHFEKSVLQCTGVVLDSVLQILEDPGEPPAGITFPPCDPESYYKYDCWVSQIEQHYNQAQTCPYSDPLQAVIAMCHGDVSETWPRRANAPQYSDESHPEETHVCVPAHPQKDKEGPHPSRHVMFYGTSYDRVEERDVIKQVLRGRRPCITESGYMGLIPAYASACEGSLLLAIVAACSVPLLLRERNDGTYQLVGTCFVQGWMEGEALTEMMAAENAAAFWELIHEGEKLKIT